MNKYFAILVIISGCGPWSLAAAAQTFQDLSTTEDGSALYFSSPIRQKETDRSFHSKIFPWNAASGIRVVAEVRDAGEFDGCTPPNFYQLRGPQVSLNGSVLAYTAARPTANSPHCSPGEPNQGVVARPGPAVTLAGNIAISPNGRYAITTTTAAVADNFHIVTDLATGAARAIMLQIGGKSLANIRRQRQLGPPSELSPNCDLAEFPIDIFKFQADDFAGAESEPGKQHQNRVTAPCGECFERSAEGFSQRYQWAEISELWTTNNPGHKGHSRRDLYQFHRDAGGIGKSRGAL